jgi:hypothetical protein
MGGAVMAPGATPGRRLGARPAESANRSARRPDPIADRSALQRDGFRLGWSGRIARLRPNARADRVRLGRRNRGDWPVRSCGRTARPARRRRGRDGCGFTRSGCTAASRRGSSAAEGKRAAGGRHPGHSHGRPEPPDAQARSPSIAWGHPANGRAHRKRPGRSRALRSVQHGNRRGRDPGVVDQKSRWTRKRTCETESCEAVRGT